MSTTITLKNGVKMPFIGLGTGKLKIKKKVSTLSNGRLKQVTKQLIQLLFIKMKRLLEKASKLLALTVANSL